MSNRLLITGADGFVGRHLVPAAVLEQWQVTAVLGPDSSPVAGWDYGIEDQFPADLTSAADRKRIAAVGADVVIHLAAISSGAAARRDPDMAMQVNAEAAGELASAIGDSGETSRFLFISTGEVYGSGHSGPIRESAAVAPVSPYAASKAAAEAALLDAGLDESMALVIARAFPHTGPGQTADFVLPAFASRLLRARRDGEREVPVGNLDIQRDFLDVRDVVRAYLLLAAGADAGIYNVASGTGRNLADCFATLATMIGADAVALPDPSLIRPADIPVLIGDPSRLRAATGWQPIITFEQTLQDLIDAQAH